MLKRLLLIVLLSIVFSAKLDGVGFSGGGFLGVYELGVMDAFIEKKVVNKNTPMAGSSAGSMLSIIQCSGASFNETKQVYMDLLSYCAENGAFFCLGKLDDLIHKALEEIVPRNRNWKRCRNKAAIQITTDGIPGQPENCTCPLGNPKVVSFYKSRTDLINTVRTSSFVALISKPSCFTDFRKFEACDGGYTNNLPCPQLKVGKTCIKVGCHTNDPATIYPGMRGLNTLPFSASTWDAASFNVILVHRNVEAMYEVGRLDALYWLSQNGY